MPCRVCLGPMQESAFRRHVQQHLSFVETVLGPLPDWRSTAFWRDSSFTQAWQKGKELFLPLLAAVRGGSCRADSGRNVSSCSQSGYTHPACLTFMN